MSELYNAIREALEIHFDKKLRNSDYINNQEVWDIVEEAITNLQDMAYEYNAKVDDFIEELTDKNNLQKFANIIHEIDKQTLAAIFYAMSIHKKRKLKRSSI